MILRMLDNGTIQPDDVSSIAVFMNIPQCFDTVSVTCISVLNVIAFYSTFMYMYSSVWMTCICGI